MHKGLEVREGMLLMILAKNITSYSILYLFYLFNYSVANSHEQRYVDIENFKEIFYLFLYERESKQGGTQR